MLFCPFYIFSQEVWTLDKCIKYALKNNIDVKQNEIQIQQNKIDVKQSLENILPNLNFSGSQNHLFGRSYDPVINQYQSEKTISANYNISTQLTLFDGFQGYNNYRKNKYHLLAEIEHTKDLKFNIVQEIINAYFQVLYKRDLHNNSLRLLKLSERKLQQSNTLVEVGQLSHAKFLEVYALKEKEVYNTIQAENEFNIALLALQHKMNLRKVIEISPLIDSNFVQDTIMNVDSIYNSIIHSFPKLRELEYTRLAAEKELVLSRNKCLPSLSLSAKVGTQYSDRNSLFFGFDNEGNRIFQDEYLYYNQILDNTNSSISVNIAVPIFNNFHVKNSVSRAKLKLQSIENEIERHRKLIYKDICEIQLEITAAISSLKSAQQFYNAQLELFNDASKKYTIGEMNYIDYITIKNELSEAESNLAYSRYSYLFKRKILDVIISPQIISNW